jgi:hypothetical protein
MTHWRNTDKRSSPTNTMVYPTPERARPVDRRNPAGPRRDPIALPCSIGAGAFPGDASDHGRDRRPPGPNGPAALQSTYPSTGAAPIPEISLIYRGRPLTSTAATHHSRRLCACSTPRATQKPRIGHPPRSPGGSVETGGRITTHSKHRPSTRSGSHSTDFASFSRDPTGTTSNSAPCAQLLQRAATGRAPRTTPITPPSSRGK